MEENRALQYLLWDQHEGRRFRKKEEFMKWCDEMKISETESGTAWEIMVINKSAFPEFEKAIAFDGEGY
jgi:hypothetical protein